MKTVCLIPARGGSVRIPRKNIRTFHGKPILAYSIETAQKSGLFDAIIVSTDDHEIDHIARRYGASVIRRMPDDGSKGTQELAGEFLRMGYGEKFGVCCVLYATAPLLGWRDLVNGWQALHQPSALYAYSVAAGSSLKHIDIGGYYFGWAQAFREAVPLVRQSIGVTVPKDRCCDINTEEDWLRAESMYEALRRAP